jgi:predicted dehydrogenase
VHENEGVGALKIGVVGCGIIAGAHGYSLNALRSAGICDAEIVAVHDTETRRRDRYAEHFGGTPVGSVEEVCETADAVYVCTSTAGHLPVVAAAAAHGLPIFCEKPLARNLVEARALLQAATTPTQVGLVLRTAPVFRALAEIVRSGEFGRPMSCIWRDDQYFPNQGLYASSWRADAAVAGSGVLLEHSIHDLDIIRACFGEVEAVACTTAEHFGYAGIEDSVTALLKLECGLSVSFVSVWHQIISRGSTRRVEVVFENGMVTFDDDFTGPLTVQTSEGVSVRECRPPDWLAQVPLPEGAIGLAIRPYLEENRDFVTGVLAGRELQPALQDAVRAHELVDACYRSASAGGALLTC